MKVVFKYLSQLRDKRMGFTMKCNFLILFVVAAFALFLNPSLASAVSILGSDLASFAVLGASGVTNVPTSTIGGNLGSSPNASVGGGYTFTSGSVQANTALAQNAQLQLDAAILTVNGFGPGTSIGSSLDTWQSANGNVITPGTYSVGAAPVNLTGNLILDGGGSNSAVWNFLFSSTLITSTTSNVTVQNVGNGALVGLYWTVGSDATLNGPTFAGNVLANGLISSDGNLTIDCGRLLSANSAVTLIQDKISITGCGSGGYDQGVNIGSGGTGGGTVPPVPEPGTFMLLGFGLGGLAFMRKRIRK